MPLALLLESANMSIIIHDKRHNIMVMPCPPAGHQQPQLARAHLLLQPHLHGILLHQLRGPLPLTLPAAPACLPGPALFTPTTAAGGHTEGLAAAAG